jgi:pyroglutamyl-peptidase
MKVSMNRRDSLKLILGGAVAGLMPGLAMAADAPRVLVTGFGDWGDHTDNVTAKLIHVLADKGMNAHVLPVDYRKAPEQLDALCDSLNPDIVLCLGMAYRAKGFRFEPKAGNKMHMGWKDEAGMLPSSPEVDPSGPPTYNTTLPVGALVRALRAHHIPCEVSHETEDFICNQVFYHMMQRMKRESRTRMAGLVHIPRESQSLPLSDMVKGVEIILDQCAQELRHTAAHRPVLKL